MKISDAGLALIKQFEGLRLTTYKDVAGFPTIGYGHLLEPGETYPDGITEEQATTLLETDVQNAELCIGRLVKAALTQGQFDALVDFVFNLGALRLGQSTLLKYLNAGRYQDAGAQLLRWDYAGGKIQPGLLARRQSEAALWNSSLSMVGV